MIMFLAFYFHSIYITNKLNGCVLELKDNPEDGHHVVISRRGLLPYNMQQWYLIDQSDDGTFLIVSKLNEKVLSCESGEKPSKDSVLWKKDGDLIRSVPRENYELEHLWRSQRTWVCSSPLWDEEG